MKLKNSKNSFLPVSHLAVTGLIPWDDDLDLCILEDDEDRLLSCVRKVLGKFQLITNILHIFIQGSIDFLFMLILIDQTFLT